MTDGAENNRKGHWFEKQFAAYMTDRMGFSEANPNVKLDGKYGEHKYEIDVVGVKKSIFWNAVWILALVGIILGEMAVVAPRACTRVTNTVTLAGTKVQKTTGLASPVAGVAALGLVLFIIGTVGDRHSRKKVWVECKNLKITVKRTHIFELDGKVKDVQKALGTKRKERFDAVWYVTTTGYDIGAVAIARQYGITLFRAVDTPSGLSFERVS